MKLRCLPTLILLAVPACAQLVPDFQPPDESCCVQFAAQKLADQLQDWSQIGFYHKENVHLAAQPVPKNRVVFFGDAITAEWKLAVNFPGKPYLNRGIPGQTTPQMLVRFFPDVVNLHPAAVVLLAGINDIARNTGPQTLEMIGDNIRAMCELARAHDIKIVLGLILPVSDYTKHKQTEHHPLADITRLNYWIRKYAAEIHAEVADFYTAVVDDKGMLKEGYSEDGAHANAESYARMAPVAQAAIERAIK
jgi:lysophospholipase L1-like esterase